MKKKLIVLILVVQIVFFGLFVTSCTKSETVVSYDGIYVDKFSDEAINQLKFVKNAYYVSKIVPEEIKTDKIVIPSTWKDGNKIVSIGPNVLGNNNKITDIVIQEGIMQIMDEAFYKCSGLTSITIPDSVTEIGDSAFVGCSGLTSITIPGSIKNIRIWFSDDGETLFSDDGDNETLFPDDVDNETLREVVLQDGITSIGYKAFANCSGLTSITIPDSVTEIGDWAFAGCSGLTSITIPNSVTEIGEGAFIYCSGLTSITIPGSIKNIRAWFSVDSGTLFADDIGNETLREVVLQDGITSIGYKAFAGCSSLTSITIPDSVTVIGQYAFAECSGLIEMNYTGTMSQWHNVKKGHPFLHYCPLSVIHCTDGDYRYRYNIQ